MTTFYTVIEVLALLACIIIPLAGPRKTAKKKQPARELSDIAVNDKGYLEHLHPVPGEEHPAH
jgi:hypothetical protein